MSASEPRLVPVHALCGRTCSEERAATHPTLYGAAGAARAPHAVPGARLRGHARAAGTSPSCARCWRAAGVWSRLAEALLWASSSSRHCPCPMVGCRCPQPSTRRVLCAPRAVRVAPRGAGYAGLGPTEDLCGRCELVAGRLDARRWTAWHRSADPVASAALPSRGLEAAASGPFGIGLRRRCTDAAVGTPWTTRRRQRGRRAGPR